jgi:hypothetical protein
MEDVMAGRRPAGRFAAAVAGAEGKPLRGMEGGYEFALHEAGPVTETPLATARVRTEGARQGQLAASGRAADALAALRTRTDPNLRSAGAGGVEVAEDEEGNPIYVRRGDAPGMRPAPRPRAPAPTTPKAMNASQLKAVGQAVDEITAEEGFGLAPADRARLVSEVQRMVNDPESGYQADPVGAAQEVLGQWFSTGRREGNWNPFKANRLVPPAPGQRAAGAIAPPAPAGKPIPALGGGVLPPEARAKLREGVVTKFANGQTWTLTGGQPVQVQ